MTWSNLVITEIDKGINVVRDLFCLVDNVITGAQLCLILCVCGPVFSFVCVFCFNFVVVVGFMGGFQSCCCKQRQRWCIEVFFCFFECFVFIYKLSSTALFLCVSVCLSLCLSISLSLSVCFSLSLSVCFSLCLSLSLSVCLCLSFCPPPSLCKKWKL